MMQNSLIAISCKQTKLRKWNKFASQNWLFGSQMALTIGFQHQCSHPLHQERHVEYLLVLNPKVFVIFIFYKVRCLCGIIFKSYVLNYGKGDVTNVYNIDLVDFTVGVNIDSGKTNIHVVHTCLFCFLIELSHF